MSFLDINKARADYKRWVNGTDDPPTISEREARRLSFQVTGIHFPNLLAAYTAQAVAVERLTAERDSARELVVRLEQDNAEALRIARVALDPTQAVVATPYRQINALRDIQRVLGAFPDDETGVQA